ncbi:MAG: hypothetical protein ABI304_12260 [Rudaea sp.]
MQRISKRLAISLVAALAVMAAQVAAQSSGGPYRIETGVIAGGGGTARGGAFALHGTFGQSATEVLSASTYGLHGGFWASIPVSTDTIFSDGFGP